MGLFFIPRTGVGWVVGGPKFPFEMASKRPEPTITGIGHALWKIYSTLLAEKMPTRCMKSNLFYTVKSYRIFTPHIYKT